MLGHGYTPPLARLTEPLDQISGGVIAAGAGSRNYVVRCLVVTNINPAIEAAVLLRLNDTPPT